MVEDPDQLAYLTQTTLSLYDTKEIVARLRERFPTIIGPASDDICYATQNRQEAVESVARDVQLILVVGSPNSSNSNRLVEVAERCGVHARLIDDASGIRPEWLEGVESVGSRRARRRRKCWCEQVSQRLAEIGFTDQIRRRPDPRRRAIHPAAGTGSHRCRRQRKSINGPSSERILAVKIVRQLNRIALLGVPTSAASLAPGHERGPAACARRKDGRAADARQDLRSPITAIAPNALSRPTTSIRARGMWVRCWRRSRSCGRKWKWR